MVHPQVLDESRRRLLHRRSKLSVETGAEPVPERVVRDRNHISSGGVTAGIDFGLTLAAELAGEETAKLLQLAFKYDPQPPFDCGTPDKAGSEYVARLRTLQHERIGKAEEKTLSIVV